LQEPELHEVARSGTDRLPLDPVRVDLVSEAQLRHGLNTLWETDSNPSRDKPDHTLAISTATTYPIYQSSSECDSDSSSEVHMVG
jgi:hypothetical protein